MAAGHAIEAFAFRLHLWSVCGRSVCSTVLTPITDNMAGPPRRARFTEVERGSARGLRRFDAAGAGVSIGRRVGRADVWLDGEGRPFVRFSTARIQHWYRLSPLRPLPWTASSWHDQLGDRLARWLADAMLEEFE